MWSFTDLISIVVMSCEAQVAMRAKLTNWMLHNKLLDIREWSKILPVGPGNYREVTSWYTIGVAPTIGTY